MQLDQANDYLTKGATNEMATAHDDVNRVLLKPLGMIDRPLPGVPSFNDAFKAMRNAANTALQFIPSDFAIDSRGSDSAVQHAAEPAAPLDVLNASGSSSYSRRATVDTFGSAAAGQRSADCSCNQPEDLQSLQSFGDVNLQYSDVGKLLEQAQRESKCGDTVQAGKDLQSAFDELTSASSQLAQARDGQTSTFTADQNLQDLLSGQDNVFDDTNCDLSSMKNILTAIKNNNGSSEDITGQIKDLRAHFNGDTYVRDFNPINQAALSDYIGKYGGFQPG